MTRRMLSARKIAKTVCYHARRARIRVLATPRRMSWLRRRLRLPRNEVFDPLLGPPPVHIAITRLSEAANFRRPLPEIPGAHPDARDFFAARAFETNAPAYVAEITDGVAWGHPTGGVFTAEGQFIPAFTHDPCGPEFHTVWSKLHLPRPQWLAGRVLYLVTPEAGDNFHHWMIDLLPRFGLVRRAGYQPADFTRVIVNHADRRYQRATLHHLGFTDAQLIRADENLLLRADQLVVPSLKPNNQSIPANDIAFLRDTFLPRLPAAGEVRRRLFLTRSDAGFRRLKNEADLHPLLRAHGFEIISPSTLSVPEQARLFSEAEIVAGPAGAAFANLVFASPGARVLEIAPPGWLAVYHWMISARGGLSHTILLGEGPVMRGVPDVSARARDFVVDPRKFAAALESLCAAPAAAARA